MGSDCSLTIEFSANWRSSISSAWSKAGLAIEPSRGYWICTQDAVFDKEFFDWPDEVRDQSLFRAINYLSLSATRVAGFDMVISPEIVLQTMWWPGEDKILFDLGAIGPFRTTAAGKAVDIIKIGLTVGKLLEYTTFATRIEIEFVN